MGKRKAKKHVKEEPQKKKINMSSEHVTRVLQIQAMGRPFELGMLYDCRSDTLIPGITLWTKEKLQNDLTVKKENTQSMKIETSDSLSDKSTLLDVEGSLKLSFLGGLISVSGSAKYLDDRVSSSHQERVTLSYQCTTKFENLSMQTLAIENIDYPDVFDKQEATHVVTGIQYGARAVFIFDKQYSSSSTEREVKGSVEVIVRCISAFQIEGSASFELNDNEKEVSKSLNCTFYGDVRPKTNPTTFEEAIKVYKDLNELVGENGEPILIWLYPLEKLDSAAAKLAREISVSVISQVEMIFEGFQDIFVRCNDLFKLAASSTLPSFQKLLDRFKSLVKQEQLVFQQKLLPILPRIRGGVEPESVLIDIIQDLQKSVFNCENLNSWVSEKEKQLKVIVTICKSMEEIKFASAGDLEATIMDPRNQHILCFILEIPTSTDKQIVAMEHHLHNSMGSNILVFSDEKEDLEATRATIESARLFKNYWIANKQELMDDEKKTEFIIAESPSTLQEIRGTIHHYELGKLVNRTFVPPAHPDNIEITKLNHNTLELKWDPAKPGTEEIVAYEIQYQTVLNGTINETESRIITGESSTTCQLSQLKPNTAYQLKCRTIVRSGVSTFCVHSTAVVTLPSSPPLLKEVRQIDDTLVEIKFEEPAVKADSIRIKGYHVYYKTDSSINWEVPIELGSEEVHETQIDVKFNETYVFKVRAVYDTEYHQIEDFSNESEDSRVSQNIFVVENFEQSQEKTAVFRDGLKNVAQQLEASESESDFMKHCQQNLESLWEHAQYVPGYWIHLLQEDTFRNFLQLIVDYKDVFGDNDKHLIKLLLRQLLNLTGNIEFSCSSELKDWVKVQVGSSEEHRRSIDDLAKRAQELVGSDQFLSYCKDYLEEVLEHARFVPDYWKALLKQGRFTNFFSKLISFQERLEGKPFITLILRQLITIAGQITFIHREKLIDISGQQMKEVDTSEMEEHITCDIPSFLFLMKETELPKSWDNPDILISEITSRLNSLLNGLQKSDKLDERYQACLLESLAISVKYDISSGRFEEPLSIEDVKKLVEEVSNNWYLFEEHVNKGTMECQAFLFILFMKSVENRKHSPVICKDNKISTVKYTKREEEEFNIQVDIIGEDMTTEIRQTIEKWAKVSPFHWTELKREMKSLQKGDTSVLIEKTLIMEEVESLKGTEDCNNEEEYCYFDASGSVETIQDFLYLETLLKTLGLEDFFPAKISLWNVTEIQSMKSKGDQYKKKVTDIPWQVLKKLIMIDYTGRESIFTEIDANEGNEHDEIGYYLDDLPESTDDATSLNPLDTFLATFLCCNPILKQTVISKMFTCKLAIPFIFPTEHNKLGMSIWALRSIITEWRGKDQAAAETSVLNFPLHVISFLRIKRPSTSKSKLINDILNNQAHHTFFNQDSVQGMTEKRFSNGMVEASWFLPSGKETSNFSDVLMLLNLRGDCSKYKDQVKFLSVISTVVVLMVDAEDVALDISRALLKNVFEKCPNVVVILSSQVSPPDKKSIKIAVLQIKELVNKETTKEVKIIFGFKPDGRKSAADLKNEIRQAISERILKEPTLSFIDSISLAKENGLDFILDESDPTIKKGKLHAENVFQHIKDIPLSECKQQLLPLQGETWKEWSRLLKQQHRVGGKSLEETSLEQKGKIGMDMAALRDKQSRICQNCSPLVLSFRANLMELVEQGDCVVYFLQWLKIFLDEQSRSNLPELAQTYRTSWWRFREEKKNPDTGNEQLRNLKREADRAEQQLADASFGLEHLFRELAQMYETVVTSANVSEETKQSYERIPLVAAKLLLKGQPLEIMDGDAANVPLTWIKAVLESVRQCIGDKKLFVLSVLGIQSSGKSTLLNTMFGLQFAVSAGRCTRGVFMQLVPVNKDSGPFQFEYILVVDTEGLRAPELGQQKHDHDNELATLVIGLGDVTILNVKGENTAEVRDVLQIAVHAFLRMRIVNHNLTLRQSCVFIHQNVPAINAKEKMEHGHRKLQEDLDEMTKEAAYQEKFVNIKSFSDLIDYDGEKHVFYFSDLWQGDPPMAPANPGYSENVEKVRQWLLEDLAAGQKTFYTLSDMKLRIEDLWNGVLADDFVFSFRNSLEIKAYRGLEDKYCYLIFSLEQCIVKWLKITAELEMNKCLTAEDLQHCHTNLTRCLGEEINNQGQRCHEELDTYFEENNLKDIIIQWKEQKKVALEMTISDMTLKTKEEMYKMKESILVDIYQREKAKDHEVEIMKKADQLAEKQWNKEVSDSYLEAEFNKVWIRWTNELALRERTYDTPIDVVVERLLFNYQKDIRMNLNQYLQHNPLTRSLNLKQLEGSISFNDVQSEFISVSSLFVSSSSIKEEQIEKRSLSKRIKQKTSEAMVYVGLSKPQKSSQNKVDEERQHKMQLENKCRHHAVKLIDRIMRIIDNYLIDLFTQDTGFHHSYAAEVINKIITAIKKHNGTTTEEYPFTLLPNLQSKISVHACTHAVECFKKLESIYQEKHGIKAKLEVCKGRTWTLFINKVKKSSEEITAAALFWECLKEWIKKQVSRDLERGIPADILQEFALQKYHLLLRILDDLADREDIGDYKEYITDAFSYSKHWIKVYTEERLFVTDVGSPSKYSLDAEIKIGSTMRIVQNAIEFATNCATEERSKSMTEVKAGSMTIWIRAFCTYLQENHLPFNETILGTLVDSNVSEFTNFQRHILRQLDEEQKILGVYFKSIDAKSIKWQGEPPITQIMEKLWGCSAQCPFCREPCLWMQNHEGQSHNCLQHRPQGVGGQFWLNSKKLVTENCNWMVNSSDRKFVCTGRTWEEAYAEAQKVDLAFLLDATGSMKGHITAVKDEVHRIVKKIKEKYQNLQIRLAFVGYRDHCDGSDRIEMKDFTVNVDDFQSFVSGVKASGGGDAAEDVFGGLEEAGKLSWTSVNRVLVHFADAPCHGSRFHAGVNDNHSNYNKTDYRGLKIEDLIAKLTKLEVQYYFGKINVSTDKMIDEFHVVSGDQMFPRQVNASNAADVMNVVAESVTATIHETMAEWRNKGRSGIVSDDGEEKKGKCKDVWHRYKQYKMCLPKWDIAPDPSAESSQYWQWFMFTYSDELREFHEAKLPDMPESWRTIDVSKAKESLRKYCR